MKLIEDAKRVLETADEQAKTLRRFAGAIVGVYEALTKRRAEEDCHCGACERLRQEESFDTFKCEQCGYQGTPVLVECACYDEWAMACTPKARGPGCSHGCASCPACDDGEHTYIIPTEVWSALLAANMVNDEKG